MTPGPPDHAGGDDDRDEQGGGPPEGRGPPAHVELPAAVPDHVRKRLTSGRRAEPGGNATGVFGI